MEDSRKQKEARCRLLAFHRQLAHLMTLVGDSI
jgi:hypothetical protein